MQRLGIGLYALMLAAAGCGGVGKTCATSAECGDAEVCLSAHCAALSCGQTWYAVDPSTGSCRPLPACGNSLEVRAWASCGDPCGALGEYSCVGDPRCQPVYATATQECPPDNGGACANVATNARTFLACRANPLPVDPCAKLDATTCASDARCEVLDTPTTGCDCPPNADCVCAAPSNDPNVPANPDPAGGPICVLKSCFELMDAQSCNARPDCTTNEPVAFANGTGGAPPPLPPSPPSSTADDPAQDGGVFSGCFPTFGGSCNGLDEATCLAHAECHPVGTACYCPAGASCKCSGGTFQFCEGDDGLDRCNSDDDCNAGSRCNNDEQCAPPNVPTQPTPIPFNAAPGSGAPVPASSTASLPSTPVACPGLCVPKGCAGYGEARCNTDPTCQPIYQLECSPYGGGGFNGQPSGPCGGPTAGGADPVDCGNPCEPTFTGCTDANPGSVVDADKSVLIREPHVVDDPEFAFTNVMRKLSGAQDPTPFVEAWLNQIANDTISPDGRTANARSGAADFLSTAPRRPDGHLDLDKLAVQVTSLSNWIDLAGPHDCGEARISYALEGGILDRRHRMTIIVEMGQPDDGAACASVAATWVALSKLSGDAYLQAVRAIYAPLISPAHLNQVRTNEFLVGPLTDFTNPPAWELREWHLGADAQLHLALSKQAIDPTLAQTPEFLSWVEQNAQSILASNTTVPAQFLAVTSSENGSRISLQPFSDGSFHPDVETAINKMACAGCHTTEFNTAFTHVGERYQGLGRARISEFLRQQLPLRAQNLWNVAQGRLTAPQRQAALTATH